MMRAILLASATTATIRGFAQELLQASCPVTRPCPLSSGSGSWLRRSEVFGYRSASSCYTAQSCLAARRVLPGHSAELSSEFTAALECTKIGSKREDRVGGNGAKARNGEGRRMPSFTLVASKSFSITSSIFLVSSLIWSRKSRPKSLTPLGRSFVRSARMPTTAVRLAGP